MAQHTLISRSQVIEGASSYQLGAVDNCTAFHSRVKCTADFVNKIFSVIENQNKQQIRHKKIGANEVYD